MTETASTRTKRSLTATTVCTEDVNPMAQDRWTHNINYRQLVVSTCIGIVQFWWHPYLHNLEHLLPFLFLYNVFSILLGYPMFYLELAIGVVTKKGVLTCWDMSPAARGVGLSMLMVSMWTALATGMVAAWCLAQFVHSFHVFLPWLHCAAQAKPPCAARHRPLPAGSDTPPQSFFFNFVLQLKRDGLETGMGPIVQELACYYTICWVLIYSIASKRIYSYSKLVLFKDVIAYFVLVTCAAGAYQLKGAGHMFHKAQWNVLYTDLQIWREAIENAILQMALSQGSLIMLGSYCPKERHYLSRTALVAFAASKTTSMLVALTLGAVHGALQKDYENSTNIWGGASSSMVLWEDYVARIPGSQFWSCIVFFTLFTLALSSTALLVQTVVSTLTGRSVRHISLAFLLLLCVLFIIIGIITLSTQAGLFMVNFIMNWPALKPRVLISSFLGFIVTFVYGQSTFCEDIYFAVEEYPCILFRIAWAIAPFILMISFGLTLAGAGVPEVTVGWSVVTMILLPIAIVLICYLIFKFRVRNIVRTEK